MVIKFTINILIISLLLNSSACAVRPPLKKEEWIQLSSEERKLMFESILQEPSTHTKHLKYLYISFGGLIAFVGLGSAFEGKSESGIYPWLAFLSSFGAVWTGISALIQKNNTHQRRRIAIRELTILDHPEWRADKIRAIRAGRIDIGYEAVMVIAAWGSPQQKIQNVSFHGQLYEEWTYYIKKNTKVFINSDRKVAIIQTSQMTYFSKAPERSEDIK